jgi:hypothetical protein
MMVRSLIALLALTSLGGCVERRREPAAASVDPSELTSAEAPRPEHALRIRFEDKLELIGYDVTPDTAIPGEPLEVTFHWKVLRAIDPGFKLFTHVEDGKGGPMVNADGEGDARRVYPPGRWRPGQYVRDPVAITLPAAWAGHEAVFYVGLWNGPRRMHVLSGPSDGADRARAAAIPVSRTGAPARAVPTLAVRRAEGITLDGRLDEPAWRTAARTDRFVNTMNGTAAAFTSHARMLYDAEYLYLGFEVDDRDLASPFRQHDDHLWEQDCVELFLVPAAGPGYVEIQVSPRGVTFDTRYDSRRAPRPFGHLDFESGVEAQVVTRGEVDDDEADEGYVVEARIPFARLGLARAPAPGASYRANMYVMNRGEHGIGAAGWSPPMIPDFHAPDRFGRLTFE